MNTSSGEDVVYRQQMALQHQAHAQQPLLLSSEQTSPFDAALLSADQDTERNIDQEIEHLMKLKQQLRKRQQQAQLLCAEQQHHQARLAAVTAGLTQQSLDMPLHSASGGWSDAADMPTAGRYCTSAPRHSIDLGTLATMSALGPNYSNGDYNASDYIHGTLSNRNQNSQSPLAGQYAGQSAVQMSSAAAACRRPAGLPKSPLPSSSNLAAAGAVGSVAVGGNNMLLSAGETLQQLQLQQPSGVRGMGCSTPLMSQDPAPLCPQKQPHLQSMLYVPAVSAEVHTQGPAQSAAPATWRFDAAPSYTSNFATCSHSAQLSEVVPDFTCGQLQDQQVNNFMNGQTGATAAIADRVYGNNSSFCGSFDLGASMLPAGGQGLLDSQPFVASTSAAFGSFALLQQQQQYSRRHSIDVAAFDSLTAACDAQGYNSSMLGLQMAAAQHGSSTQVTGSSQSFTGPSCTNLIAQVASSSRSFTAGCGHNLQCGMHADQHMGHRSMQSMKGHGDLVAARMDGAVAAAVHDARMHAISEQQDTRNGERRHASFDLGAYNRRRLETSTETGGAFGANESAAAGMHGTSVPLLATPPATPVTTAPWGRNQTSPTLSPNQCDGNVVAASSAPSNGTSRRNSSSSSDASSGGASNGPASTKQQPICAAPKWAGSFWHPLSNVEKVGPAVAKKGTGVFIPPGMTDLL